MRFGNDMITFEEAVAYLKDMPRFTVKKNPADSRDLKWFLKKLGNPEKDLRIRGSFFTGVSCGMGRFAGDQFCEYWGRAARGRSATGIRSQLL